MVMIRADFVALKPERRKNSTRDLVFEVLFIVVFEVLFIVVIE